MQEQESKTEIDDLGIFEKFELYARGGTWFLLPSGTTIIATDDSGNEFPYVIRKDVAFQLNQDVKVYRAAGIMRSGDDSD